MEAQVSDVKHAYAKAKEVYRNLPVELNKHQLKAILAVLHGRDLLCVIPTGSGKTYGIILPAVIKSIFQNGKVGTMFTVIIAPLDALMLDLKRRISLIGLSAEIYTSATFSNAKYLKDVEKADGPTYFIFSPEVFVKARAMETIFSVDIQFVMIDEGHCVSQWGMEGKYRPAFRSQYKELHVIRTHTDAPVAVFTATLTPKMMKEVVQQTCLIQDAMDTIVEPPDRPNIYLELKPGKENLEELDYLIEEVRTKKKHAEKTIVFATTPQAASNLYLHFMRKLGANRSQKTADGEEMFAALFAGATGPVTKKEIVDLFINPKGYLRVLFATSSFGMGVDIPDVRKVIVWGLSCDPVTMRQQIGRAGRDDEPSHALIYNFKTPFYVMNKGDLILREDTCLRLQLVRCFLGCDKLVLNHSACTCPGPCQCTTCYCCSCCKSQCRCRLYPKKKTILNKVLQFFKPKTN